MQQSGNNSLANISMVISHINETLLKGIQQAQIEQVQAISKVLGIKMGDTFLAQVKQLATASPEERAQLAEQIAKTLSQLNANSTAPATKALINQLLAQQTMVQSSQLQLVTLNTQTTHQQIHQLLTYTQLPLEQGQSLLLKLDTNQRLVILGALAKEGLNHTQLQSLNPRELAQYVKPLPGQPIIGSTHHPSPGNTGAATPPGLEALRSSITSLLPHKDSGQDLLTHMQWITQQVQKMPLQERNQWFTSELQQALKTLANHLRSPQELTHPKLLANAVHNSGVFFEQKLTNLIPGRQPSGAAITSNIALKPDTLIKLTATTKDPLLNPQKAASGDKLLNTPKNPDQLIKQDLKGALLGVLHQLEEELDPLVPLLTNKPAANPFTQTTQPQLAQLFAQIMGMPTGNSQHKELNLKNLRAQLMMLLHQYTSGSLAKIQLQQIHALNHQLGQADSNAPTQSWQFDIPLRHGQETHHLHMHLEYQWVEDEKKEGQQAQGKTRQWQVMLGFSMDAIGQFYVQLTLLGNSLSANFWAERTSTLEKTRQKLDELQQQLEREGIQVKSMQCLAGLPPKPKMSLGYSLVDIQT